MRILAIERSWQHYPTEPCCEVRVMDPTHGHEMVLERLA
jgi:hypothetical protein